MSEKRFIFLLAFQRLLTLLLQSVTFFPILQSNVVFHKHDVSFMSFWAVSAYQTDKTNERNSHPNNSIFFVDISLNSLSFILKIHISTCYHYFTMFGGGASISMRVKPVGGVSVNTVRRPRSRFLDRT